MFLLPLLIDFILEWAEEEDLAMLGEVIGCLSLSVWEFWRGIFWSLGGGGGVYSFVIIDNVGCIGGGGGSLSHWLETKDGLLGIPPYPLSCGCTKDSGTLAIPGWGYNMTLGGT